MELNNVKIFELPCFDGRKSFYGKAKVIEKPDGEKYLQSYNTIVCKIDCNGKYTRMWDGESLTTSRHIKSFREFYGLSKGV